MPSLLAQIQSPLELHSMSMDQLKQLGDEVRAELCRLVQVRSAHFASNLGVVELCLALHTVFDFGRDRLIWDTGHQIYPHKLITGRYRQFHSIRTKGGLMGYPNPAESPYDLFMTGHAGCSISCALGLRTADDLLGQGDRRTVAVIGDGALPSGIVFEALNNAGGLGKDLLVILNDNKMSICSRVGGLARYLDRACKPSQHEGLKQAIQRVLFPVPPAEERRSQEPTEGLTQAAQYGGLLFEELGWRYFGPVDGHNLEQLITCLEAIRGQRGPLLLHVFTEKGHRFQPAAEDPVKYHTPAPFIWNGSEATPVKKSGGRHLTNVASESIYSSMQANPNVVVITAAMCQGNNLERVRQDMPDRFFDTGITESHAVAFAAGLAKNGVRPIVAIYSTFLQRAYDQLFQEVALQDLPVTFCLDRAGLTGPDGPTHHGVFDTAYLRAFPNFTVMAPADELELPYMLEFALQHQGPVAIRYPKAIAEPIERVVAPVRLGQAEVLDWGMDGMLIAYGSLLHSCLKAAERLRRDGLDVGVINARFAKPIDLDAILPAIAQGGFVLTVEECSLAGGFGDAVLAAANEAGLDTRHVRRLGVPDRFVEHGERHELLAALGLDAEGVYQRARELNHHGRRPTERMTTAVTSWAEMNVTPPLSAASSPS